MKANNIASVVQQKRSLRAKGIGYDTGFSFDGVTRRPFDQEVVRRELQIIRNDLHCNAVRLFGNDLDRLEFAAWHAAELGLEVWFSPFTYQLSSEEMLKLLADGAERAERIRRRGVEVVYVTGAELSLFNTGFLPGDSLEERVGNLLLRKPETLKLLAGLPAHINSFLSREIMTMMSQPGYFPLVRMIIAEAPRFPQLSTLFISTVTQRGLTIITSLLQEGREQQFIADVDLDTVAHMLLGGLLTYALTNLVLGEQAMPTLDLADAVVEVIMRTLTP